VGARTSQTPNLMNGAATTTIEAMRRESQSRTILLITILFVFASLMIGTSFPFELSDLILPIGPPLTHVFHASLFLASAFGVLMAFRTEVARRTVWPVGRGPSLGTTVPNMITELAGRMRVEVEAQLFGGMKGGEVEAVIIGSRKIIRIPASRLREAKTNPRAFQFVIAHELTHLASGDPRWDRWIGCAYAIWAVAMLASIGSVFWAVGKGILLTRPIGFDAVLWSLRSSMFVVLVNMASMGILAILLFLERRSAMRLREFHADAGATELVGERPDVIQQLKRNETNKLKRWLERLVADHPEQQYRQLAFAQLTRAFQADRILFVLQGFFAAMIIEILMQLLFVNASPNISTIAERRHYLFESLGRFPASIFATMIVAVTLTILAQFLMLGRLRILIREAGGARRMMPIVLLVPILVGAGACLALWSSQTFLWELSQKGWRLVGWLDSDPDRASVYAASFLGTALVTAIILMDDGQWSMTRAGTALLSVVPVFCAFSAGLWFYH
jgi:Peptidase family M48